MDAVEVNGAVASLAALSSLPSGCDSMMASASAYERGTLDDTADGAVDELDDEGAGVDVDAEDAATGAGAGCCGAAGAAAAAAVAVAVEAEEEEVGEGSAAVTEEDDDKGLVSTTG